MTPKSLCNISRYSETVYNQFVAPRYLLHRSLHFIIRCESKVILRWRVIAAPCNKAGEMSHQWKWGLDIRNVATVASG